MSSVPGLWRKDSELLRLRAIDCGVCGAVIFPAGPCRKCLEKSRQQQQYEPNVSNSAVMFAVGALEAMRSIEESA